MKKFIFCILLLTLIVLGTNVVFGEYEIHPATQTYTKAAVIPKDKIIVYPNPWIPESGISTLEITGRKNTLKHGHLSAEGWIKFAGMQKETGSLKIYDITGNLVRNFRWNVTDERKYFPLSQFEASVIPELSGKIDYYESQEHYDINTNKYNIIHWDGKDNNFEYVKSGVYIWILTEDGGRSHNGKLVVIR